MLLLRTFLLPFLTLGPQVIALHAEAVISTRLTEDTKHLETNHHYFGTVSTDLELTIPDAAHSGDRIAWSGSVENGPIIFSFGTFLNRLSTQSKESFVVFENGAAECLLFRISSDWWLIDTASIDIPKHNGTAIAKLPPLIDAQFIDDTWTRFENQAHTSTTQFKNDQTRLPSAQALQRPTWNSMRGKKWDNSERTEWNTSLALSR